MNDKDIDQLLEDLLEQPIPEANKDRKNAIIQTAKSEFLAQSKAHQQKNSQGFEASSRPIGNRDILLSRLTKPIWSFFMNTTNNHMLYKAFGTAVVAFIAVSIVFMMPNTHITNNTKEFDTISEKQSTSNIPPQKANESTSGSSELAELLPTEIELSTDGKGLANKELKEAVVSSESNVTKKSDSLNASSTVREASENTLVRITKQRKDQRTTTGKSNSPGLIASDHSVPLPRIDEREEYAKYTENSIKQVFSDPISTFSIDVDTASYSLVRNQLNNGYLPKPQAVRTEELINYFDYDYPVPNSTKQPFEPTISALDSPWNSGKKLVHIGIKGYDIPASKQPDSNLVFLLDVSGSMNATNKLPLVKQSVGLLLDTLKPTDMVSIVVYAGAAGTVLEPTKAKDKHTILSAIQQINAGGSTAGGAGIKLAYQLAEQNFNKEGVNRIILATDGDFNVGQQSNEDLKALVERKRDNGVFLSVLGFGRNNYQDDMMQTLAQNGNGVAAYIDTLSEAKKVLVDEATSTLFPIAKDVKLQVEFNPATVSEYRLVGYETRHLNKEDFNNDKVDAGDIGAGHTVTAIYEITPANAKNKAVDEPRYSENKQQNQKLNVGTNSNEYGFLKIRYKLPTESISKLIEQPIKLGKEPDNNDAHFSVAVAGFAQLLANSKHTGELSYDDVIKTASAHKGNDPFGHRSEFIQLVRMAKIALP